MRVIYLTLVFLTLLSSAIGQNSLSSKTIAAKDSEKERWNLDKYVWSHTHYQTSKNDKPVVDFDLIDNWIVLGKDISLSSDAKYFAYTTAYTVLKKFAPDSLVILATDGSWRRSFAGAKTGFFSGNGSQYIFKNKDTLSFVMTGTDQILRVEGVLSYKKAAGDKANWVACQLKDKKALLKNLRSGKAYSFDTVVNYSFASNPIWFTCNNAHKDLIVFNLVNGSQKTFSYVIDYKLDDVGNSLLLKRSTQNGGTELQYINLLSGSEKTIWSSLDTTIIIQGYNLDRTGRQVVFTVQKKDNLSTASLWYWRPDMNNPVMKVNSGSDGIDDNVVSRETPSFSDNGQYIKFTIEKKPEVLVPQIDPIFVNVWSYFDTVLQSTQLAEASSKKNLTYKAFISVDGAQIVRETNEEKLKAESGNFFLMAKKGNKINGDRFWEKEYYLDSNWVVSIKDGSRKLLPTKQEWGLLFSPDSKYLVYFDRNQGCYFSFNVQTGVVANMCKGVPDGELIDKTSDAALFEGDLNKRTFGGACWWEKDGKLWVYSEYDIWSLDLTGKKPAINITNGYGSRHQVALKLSGYSWAQTIAEPTYFGKDILLKAKNENNGDNGFYTITPTTSEDPQLLYMGATLMEQAGYTDGEDMKPIKATEADTWIVKKQTATEAPNYFLTKDFKTYIALTHLQQHKKYNWLTSELHHFKQLDGSMGKGILYKPENFDPSKKYPVIVIFYLLLSEKLHVFPDPDYIRSPASALRNPAWLVSHGYLVFLPDVDFRINKWGPSAVNSVEGAARYLGQLPFVDGKNIAACGHSNSGRFGYYLLTHSHIFKAMSIGSGYGGTDILSLSLSIDKTGSQKSSLEWAERGSVGKGLGNLWENKEAWLDHTAVLQADNISTPLLLFHNRLDADDVRLAMELYIAMRRLQKTVWWLEYDEEGHTVSSQKNKRDFTIRYTQYFDHYLKGAPAPLWMGKGIPAKLKGVETMYELDAGK